MNEQKKARVFSREFKIGAVGRMQAGESASALARELGVRRKSLYDVETAGGGKRPAEPTRER